ncbi:hypothetical protein [Pedobacter cryophilus]|uniref:Outer membrane protein beta-barrel domain-containing protein n=1 Tax=Pedobacter cryophilus TaxID=2571271 RepID=A0A4U1BZY0_9SPHI|nr:hypothetical protein [Pedobacter cryophilus]TKB98782.1 hypothetical protein FA046_06600 [Pedobacter cryophilus]
MGLKTIFRSLFILLVAVTYSNTSIAQINRQIKNGYFYVGFDANIATLFSGTSVKTIMGVKLGYNQKVATNVFVGPQVEALFIRSPINRGARISLFAGPSTELEVIDRLDQSVKTKSSYLSTKLSWVFPLNPQTSDYVYMDCISLSTSYNSDDFLGFNKTSISLNLDFQKYDIGFYGGFNRMVNISTGSMTTF